MATTSAASVSQVAHGRPTTVLGPPVNPTHQLKAWFRVDDPAQCRRRTAGRRGGWWPGAELHQRDLEAMFGGSALGDVVGRDEHAVDGGVVPQVLAHHLEQVVGAVGGSHTQLDGDLGAPPPRPTRPRRRAPPARRGGGRRWARRSPWGTPGGECPPGSSSARSRRAPARSPRRRGARRVPGARTPSGPGRPGPPGARGRTGSPRSGCRPRW